MHSHGVCEALLALEALEGVLGLSGPFEASREHLTAFIPHLFSSDLLGSVHVAENEGD